MKTLWDNGASQNISFYSRVPNKRGGGANKQDKQGDWKCRCGGWGGVGGGVEYLGNEGQKMVNRVPLRLI